MICYYFSFLLTFDVFVVTTISGLLTKIQTLCVTSNKWTD